MATIIVAQSAGEPRETLAKGLRTLGFEVGVFDDIDGALEAASGTPISALLVDPGLLLREDMALSPRLQVRAGRQVRLLVLVERANPEVSRKFREHGADLLVRPPQDVDRLAKTLHASAPDAPWEPQAEVAAAHTSSGPVGTYIQSKPFKRKKKKAAPPIVERGPVPPPPAVAPPPPLFAPPLATPPPLAWPTPPPSSLWPTTPSPWPSPAPPWEPGGPPPPPMAGPPPPIPAPLLLTEEAIPEGTVRIPEPTRQSPPARVGLNADELFADAEEEPTNEVGTQTGASRSDVLSPPVHASADERDSVEPGGLADALEPEQEEHSLEKELFGDREEERTSQVDEKTRVGPTASLPTSPAPPAQLRKPSLPPTAPAPPVVEVEEDEEHFSLAELTGGVIPSILVVDDDPAFRGFLRDALTEHGFRVHTAINAPNALRFIKSGIAVDMVISDLSMPHMDGFELKHEIDKWARDERKPMPFIIVTGGASETQVRTAAQVKVSAVIAKPIEDMDAFFAIIVDTLRAAGVISQNA